MFWHDTAYPASNPDTQSITVTLTPVGALIDGTRANAQTSRSRRAGSATAPFKSRPGALTVSGGVVNLGRALIFSTDGGDTYAPSAAWTCVAGLLADGGGSAGIAQPSAGRRRHVRPDRSSRGTGVSAGPNVAVALAVGSANEPGMTAPPRSGRAADVGPASGGRRLAQLPRRALLARARLIASESDRLAPSCSCWVQSSGLVRARAGAK